MKVFGAWLICLTFSAGLVRAQGTTVQLPSYRYFTTNTTVSVPDRGSAYLGGVARASSGSNEFGTPLTPFRNRASGSDRSASGASVSVYIHDFAAMEEELLGRASKADRTAGSADPRRALSQNAAALEYPHQSLEQATGDPSPPSIEAIRRQRQIEQAARQSEAEEFFERGRAAEVAGKASVARIYYQMAAKRASGDLRTEVLAKLDSLRREQLPKVVQKAAQD